MNTRRNKIENSPYGYLRTIIESDIEKKNARRESNKEKPTIVQETIEEERDRMEKLLKKQKMEQQSE